MYVIVQENLFNETGFNDLMRVLNQAAIPHAVVKVVPFSHEVIGLPDDLPKEVIVYGSTTLSRVAKERGWVPGSFLNENFDAAIWMDRYGRECLNHGARLCRFADVVKEDTYPTLSHEFFLRPALDDKSFNGGVYTWEEFEEWRRKVLDLKETYTTLDADTMVVVSRYHKISMEIRLFIVDGKVVTSSVYKVGNQVRASPLVDAWVIEYGERMAALWSPDRAFVLDVALVDGYPAIVEINCINSAGFYAADVSKLVQALDGMSFSS